MAAGTDIVAPLAVAVALFGGAAWAEVRPSYGGNAAVTLSGQPTTLDPLSSRSADLELSSLLFQRLYRVDSQGVARPLLVVAVDESQPLRPRLELRPDMHFHDGRPLGVTDVVASLRRGLDDPNGWMLGPIVAVRAVGGAVELELSRRAPDLGLLLSTPAASITPSGQAPPARPIGSGPFAFVSRSSDGGIRLQPWVEAVGGRPYLDLLTMRAYPSPAMETQSFDAGGLQATHAMPSSFGPGRHNPSTVVDGPQTLLGLLCLGPSMTPELGAALASGLDKDRLRRQVREPSHASNGLAPVALGGVTVSDGKTPHAVPANIGKLTLLVDRTRSDERAVADRLLYELDRLGLEASIDAVDPVTLEARRRRGDYQLLLTTVVPPAPDGGLAELAALATVDAAAARKLLRQAPATVGSVTSARLIPLYHRAVRIQTSPDLHGITVDSAGRPTFEDAFWTHRK